MNNLPADISIRIMWFVSHPVADLFNEYSCCLQQKIKDVPELRFYRVFFYTKRYPILYEYLKLPNKQIYDIF